MASNTFGTHFTLTTCGESHGTCLIGIVDGCPAGLELSEADIQPALDRRRPGQSRYTTGRQETDTIQITSGVFEGKTTGAPIGLMIPNTDAKSKDYTDIKNLFRPGHADYTYFKKYGIRDYRGGGRASARETALWVAAGAIAQKYLSQYTHIRIKGYLAQMGSIKAEHVDWDVIDSNPFFFPDPHKLKPLDELLTRIRKAGDSVGAKVTVVATGMPTGLGDPVFGKLDARLAYAMMSINAVKGVEIGSGFNSIIQKGSEHRDEITPDGFLSNHSGGTLGGISSGQDLIVHLAFKPTSSILIPGKTIDVDGKPTTVVTKGRHDPCVGIRGVPVAEAMAALVLIDTYFSSLQNA